MIKYATLWVYAGISLLRFPYLLCNSILHLFYLYLRMAEDWSKKFSSSAHIWSILIFVIHDFISFFAASQNVCSCKTGSVNNDVRKRLRLSHIQELNDLYSLSRGVICWYTHIPFTRTIIYTFLTTNKCVYEVNITTSKDAQQRNPCIIKKNTYISFFVLLFLLLAFLSCYRQLWNMVTVIWGTEYFYAIMWCVIFYSYIISRYTVSFAFTIVLV
jgi:hypothetical protein